MSAGLVSFLGSAVGAAGNLAGSWAGSQWGRNAAEGLANHSARLSREYDVWQANRLYPIQLQSQLDNYGLERQLNLERTFDAISHMRGGLAAAGFNPLLAVGDVAGGSIQPLAMPDKTGNFSGNSSAASYRFEDPVEKYFQGKQIEQTLEANSAKVVSLKADADLARSDADLQILKNEAEKSALLGDHRPSHYDEEPVSVMTHEGWRQLRDNIAEKLRKEGYTESEARARTLDILHETEKAVDSAAGAVNSAAGYKRAFNSIRGRRIR